MVTNPSAVFTVRVFADGDVTRTEHDDDEKDDDE